MSLTVENTSKRERERERERERKKQTRNPEKKKKKEINETERGEKERKRKRWGEREREREKRVVCKNSCIVRSSPISTVSFIVHKYLFMRISARYRDFLGLNPPPPYTSPLFKSFWFRLLFAFDFVLFCLGWSTLFVLLLLLLLFGFLFALCFVRSVIERKWRKSIADDMPFKRGCWYGYFFSPIKQTQIAALHWSCENVYLFVCLLVFSLLSLSLSL